MYDARFSIPFVDHSPSEAKSSICQFQEFGNLFPIRGCSILGQDDISIIGSIDGESGQMHNIVDSIDVSGRQGQWSRCHLPIISMIGSS